MCPVPKSLLSLLELEQSSSELPSSSSLWFLREAKAASSACLSTSCARCWDRSLINFLHHHVVASSPSSPRKGGRGGIPLASKVGVSMQEQDNFFRNKMNPRKLTQRGLQVGAGVTRISWHAHPPTSSFGCHLGLKADPSHCFYCPASNPAAWSHAHYVSHLPTFSPIFSCSLGQRPVSVHTPLYSLLQGAFSISSKVLAFSS